VGNNYFVRLVLVAKLRIIILNIEQYQQIILIQQITCEIMSSIKPDFQMTTMLTKDTIATKPVRAKPAKIRVVILINSNWIKLNECVL